MGKKINIDDAVGNWGLSITHLLVDFFRFHAMERWKFMCIGLMPSKDESLMHFVIKLLLARKLLWVFNWTYCNFIFVAWHIIQRNISVHAVIVYFISFDFNFFFFHFTLINKDCRCSDALKNGMILREWTWFYNSINSWRVTSLRCMG